MKTLSLSFFIYKNCVNDTGSLTALTAKLPSQPLTSHPSVRTLLETGMKRIQKHLCFVLIEICFQTLNILKSQWWYLTI